MKIKKEYLILGSTVAVLLALFLIFNNRNKVHYSLPKIAKIKKGDITKISITKKKKTIDLTRESGKWIIMPKKYKADKSKVDGMLKSLRKFVITDLVSESGNYLLYELDGDKKVGVKVWNKEKKLIRDFELGKTAKTYNHTFVKLIGKKAVYHARGNFKSDFDVEIKDLRDKTVLKFEKDKIKSLVFAKGAKTFVLTKEIVSVEQKTDKTKDKKAVVKKEAPKKEWRTDAGKTANQEEAKNVIDTLSNLSCDEFIEDKTKKDLKNPIYSVMAKGPKEYKLFIYKKAKKDDSKFPAVSSDCEYPFLIEKWKAEKIMKEFKDLAKKK